MEKEEKRYGRSASPGYLSKVDQVLDLHAPCGGSVPSRCIAVSAGSSIARTRRLDGWTVALEKVGGAAIAMLRSDAGVPAGGVVVAADRVDLGQRDMGRSM